MRAVVVVALALTACAPVPCKAPAIVYQTVTKYVTVPAEFTKHVPTAKPTEGTVAECPDIAIQRASAIGQCNLQLDKIRKLSGEVQK